MSTGLTDCLLRFPCFPVPWQEFQGDKSLSVSFEATVFEFNVGIYYLVGVTMAPIYTEEEQWKYLKLNLEPKQEG